MSLAINKKENGISLTFNGIEVFSHLEEKPFVFAVGWNLKYKTSHGNFTVKHKKEYVIPLVKYEIVKETDESVVIKFSNGKISLTASCNVVNGYVSCDFDSIGHDGAWEFVFNSTKDEAIFGGGEQYRQLNLKGEIVTNFVSEHIVVPPIVEQTIFKKFKKYRERSHSEIDTYAPMSTFVTSTKKAYRFKVSGFGIQDFTNDAFLIFTYADCPKNFVFAVGENFKNINEKLNKDIKSNQYIPDWCLNGMILGVQGGIDRAMAKADKMLKAGAKVSGVWCQDWCGKKVTLAGSQVYWNWVVDEERYGNLKEHIEKLNKKGVHFLAYINPYLVKDGPMFNLFKEKGFLVKKQNGKEYLVKSTTFKAGMIDLTNPGAVEYLKEVIIKKNMLDLGISGYMADFGEYLPTDAVLANGDATLLHNEWPTLWAKINREAIDSHPRKDEVFFFTRSGYNGAQSYSPIMWNGDQHTCFYKDYGMPCVMPATFNLGFSGLPLLHSDTGGYISFASLFRDKELFVRWMEMNAFSPLMRTHETIRPDVNIQYDDKEVIKHTVTLTNVYSKLKQYIKECIEETKNGIPAMRPDFYNSGDFKNHKDLYSYFLGDEIYVAPTFIKGATERNVLLPKGEWIRFSDKKKYSGKVKLETELGNPCAFYLVGGKHQKLFDKIDF